MESLFNYFNLNVPLTKLKVPEEIEKLDMILEEPEISLKAEKDEPPAPAAAPPIAESAKMKVWEQFLIYIGLAVGVLLSTAITQFKNGTDPKIDISITSVILSLVISLVILPYVYGKLNVDPKSPLLIRFSLAVQQGVFWQVVFGAINP